MTNESQATYVDQNVNSILGEEKTPQSMALASAWILGNYKAFNLKIFDLENESSLASFFVLATANNNTQANAMAEQISYQFKKNDLLVYSKEGIKNSDWLLIDSGDVIVHIFVANARENYDLDSVWNHCPTLDIPQEYYFSDEAVLEEDSSKGYY